MSDHPALPRRAFMLGAAATAVAPVSTARAAVSGTRALLVGSSMMAGAFGLYMSKELSKKGWQVERVHRSASGLSRPDFFNWQKVIKKACEEFRPEVTVVMFGANDAQSLYRIGQDPRWIYWDNPQWTDLYGRRVSSFCDAATARGKIVWVGLPIMRPSKLDRRLGRINRIYRAEMSHRRDGLFIDTRAVLADRKGKYTDHLPVDGKSQLVRASDGVHVSGQGARLLLRHVLPQVEEFAAAQVRPPWARNDHSCTGQRTPSVRG